MLPFFPPGSNPNPPISGVASNPNPSQGSTFPPFPLNQVPQFNFPNPANMAMAMAMFNPNPQISMQSGMNALAAMQLFGQGMGIQQNMALQMQAQMQNLNFLASLQSANNMVQGMNQAMNSNPNLAQIANGFGVPPANQGVNQLGFYGGVQQGTNMINNVIQNTRTAAPATHVNASGKNFETNQHRVPYTRFQNNDSRQNSRQFNGSRGRGRGALSGRDGGRGLRDRRELAPEEKNPGPLEIKKKRRPMITYSEKEIKQWREARKRNFPTAANLKKKLAAKDKRAKNVDGDTELRRKQMKEVLAKQQELGVEVAEVPSHYLVGSKSRVCSSSDGFQNRFNNKRGRHEGRGRIHNGRHFSSCSDFTKNAPDTKAREPTLLKKLLNAEIKADKHRILQALRFIILNSFFDQWPDKQLEFPSVMVKETGIDSEITEGNEEEFPSVMVKETGIDSEITEGNEEEIRKLKGKNRLIESESESESEEDRESESVRGLREREKGEDKPEEGEITD